MYTKINSQAALTLVTLAEARRQCRLMPDETLDDDELTLLINVCSELAQDYTHRLLTLGSVTCEVEESVTEVQLPYGNATEITSVTVNGVDYTDYSFSDISQKVKFPYSVSNVLITYNAGYETIPAKVKQGILMMISTLFDNHNDFISGMTIEEIPIPARKLLDSVRYYVGV